jgi:hypothetical protein
MDALDVIEEIRECNPNIAAFEIAALPFAPLVDERSCLTGEDVIVVERALQLRETLRLPFWDGVMLAASHAKVVPKGALIAAVFHQSLTEKVSRFQAATLSRSMLERLSTEAQTERKLLAVTSRVHLRDGTMLHIPMLDFHVAFSNHSTALVTEIISTLKFSGKLLRSGKSYHFYGNRLIEADEMRSFLGRFLLFEPIVDRAWIAHQLIEGACALRISPRAEYGGVPQVVGSID